jgi:hypothetical protein
MRNETSNRNPTPNTTINHAVIERQAADVAFGRPFVGITTGNSAQNEVGSTPGRVERLS